MSIHSLNSDGASIRGDGDSAHPFVDAQHSTTQSVSDNTHTALVFNTELENNVGTSLHSTSANTDKFYATKDGLWHAVGWFYWSTTAWSNTISNASYIKHSNSGGTQQARAGHNHETAYHSNGYSPNLGARISSGYFNMVEGDYLQLIAWYKYWPGGSSHTINAASGTNGYNGFQMRYIGAV